ncbi:dihydrodipicolinate synthase [Fusarium sp. NRRL 25303]|nr:dihydrodipicolinate synthase [Fusarium sp. NRRL 25303]
MSAPPPKGIYVPVPTFFASKKTANYNAITPPIDIETQVAHSVYLAKNGIKGLVVLGSTGEAVHIHPRDRHAILSGIKAGLEKEGFKDYPIIAGTATNSVEETVEQLKDAQKSGSQWGLCLVPGYNAGAVTQEGIIQWFTAVADQSPIPVMIYHYPGVSNNVKVAPSTYATLAKHSNIVGCKLSHGDVSVAAQVASNPSIDHTHFHCFTGLGQQLLPVISVGFAGAIDGSAGFFPKSLVRLLELSSKTKPTDAEIQERRLLQFKVSSMEELVVKFGTVGIKDAISRLRGFGDTDGTRLPLVGGIPGGDAEWAKWKGVIDAVDEVEKSL